MTRDPQPGLEEFEELVQEALSGFPEEFQRLAFDNLAIVVEDVASDADAAHAGVRNPMHLLGMYSGVPYTEWGRDHFVRAPDVIRIYRLPILADLREGEDMREKVRRVVRHELAHRAGLDDDRLRELGAY